MSYTILIKGCQLKSTNFINIQKVHLIMHFPPNYQRDIKRKELSLFFQVNHSKINENEKKWNKQMRILVRNLIHY